LSCQLDIELDVVKVVLYMHPIRTEKEYVRLIALAEIVTDGTTPDV